MKKQTSHWGHNQMKLKHGKFYKTIGLNASKDNFMKKKKKIIGEENFRDVRGIVIIYNMWTYPSLAKKLLKNMLAKCKCCIWFGYHNIWYWGIIVNYYKYDNSVLVMKKMSFFLGEACWNIWIL